jgi:hypothetical protein
MHSVAPALIPKRSGERIKTNRRDAVTLARLHRAGELTGVWTPDAAHEAVRDLVRAREEATDDLRRKRQQLLSFLLRHSRIYSGGGHWTLAHRRWLANQKFEHAAQQIVLQEGIDAIEDAVQRLRRLEKQLASGPPSAEGPRNAVTEGAVPFGLSFFANAYVDAAGKSTLNVWDLDPGNPGGAPTLSRLSVPIRPLSWIGETVGTPSAAFRGQELTVAFTETVGCASPSSIQAIRVIRLNVFTNKVLIDSTTGLKSPKDPANVNCVQYFQPGVQVNKNGDAAFIYGREAPNLPTEARYSVIYHGSLAQPSSVLLQAGKTVLGSRFDTAGISLDPDDQAIWFVNFYGGAAKEAWIAIGRIWGK